MQAQELACPQHGGQDMVQKVSAIVAMGTSTGSYSGPTGGVTHDSHGWGGFGGYTTLSGSGQTLLAQKLAPAKKPARLTIGCWGPFMLVSGLGGGFYFLMQALFGDTREFPVPIALALALASVVVGVLFSSIKEGEGAYASRLRPWEQAMVRWNALFYCSRCDIVFVPGEGTFAPVDRMRQYIKPPEEPKEVEPR